MRNIIIKGSGHYLPENTIPNSYFLNHDFFDDNGIRIEKSNEEIIQKFTEITEIEERRYANSEMKNSEMAAIAGKRALEDAGVDKEDLDYVIVAHNYGNIIASTHHVDIMPSMSALVKHHLGIKNNQCRPYDMNFGCPGWIEAVILASQLMKASFADKILVIGSETLSRIVDDNDRSAMIFADGAGAVVLEAEKRENIKEGFLNHLTVSDNLDELFYLTNSSSLNPENTEIPINIRMKGRKVYEYALKKVPAAMKRVIDQAELGITDIDKILLHQANAKMDHAMVERLFRLYKIKEIPKDIDPMTVQKLGNSSVATVPTMFDLIRKGKLDNHQFTPGSHIIFASVGAGMNINALLYKFPK